jgi:hypothetical protein
MGISDWDKFISQAYAFLKPGGWCELQEFHLGITSDDGSMKEGGALWTWRRDMLAATKKIGIDTLVSLQHPKILKEKGFINIGERQLKIPMGPWAKGRKEKQIGIMAQKDLVDGVEGISTKLLLMVGYEPENLKLFFEEVKKELMDPKVSFGKFLQRLTSRLIRLLGPLLHVHVSKFDLRVLMNFWYTDSKIESYPGDRSLWMQWRLD